MFSKFGIIIDKDLVDILVGKDTIKTKNKLRDRTKEGKTLCSILKYENLASDYKSQMKDLKAINANRG